MHRLTALDLLRQAGGADSLIFRLEPPLFLPVINITSSQRVG